MGCGLPIPIAFPLAVLAASSWQNGERTTCLKSNSEQPTTEQRQRQQHDKGQGTRHDKHYYEQHGIKYQ
jgi:hypothetical protein